MAVDLKKVLDDSKKTPVEQIDDYCRDIFSESASARQRIVAGERVVAATLITGIAVVATGGFVIALPLAFVPFLMPLVGAVAGVAVDLINDVLGDFGLHKQDFCEHPELQPKTMDDGTWIHYPGRYYNGKMYRAVPQGPGWGALGLSSVGMYLDDYPQIQALAPGVGPDLNRRVLAIPYTPPGSFLESWYLVYSTIKECNYLQMCSALESSDAQNQEEAALLSFATLWNRNHTAISTYEFPPAYAAGDDLTLVRHNAPLVINLGKPLAPSNGHQRLPGWNNEAPPAASSTAAAVAKGAVVLVGAGLAGAAIYAFVKKKPFVSVVKSIGNKTVAFPKKAFRSTKKALHLR